MLAHTNVDILSGLDAPRADNWSTPTSKKQREEKLSALQKLKADKENAKNKPKVVPKASNRPTVRRAPVRDPRI
jgi:hypothetical protein